MRTSYGRKEAKLLDKSRKRYLFFDIAEFPVFLIICDFYRRDSGKNCSNLTSVINIDETYSFLSFISLIWLKIVY